MTLIPNSNDTSAIGQLGHADGRQTCSIVGCSGVRVRPRQLGNLESRIESRPKYQLFAIRCLGVTYTLTRYHVHQSRKLATTSYNRPLDTCRSRKLIFKSNGILIEVFGKLAKPESVPSIQSVFECLTKGKRPTQKRMSRTAQWKKRWNAVPESSLVAF